MHNFAAPAMAVSANSPQSRSSTRGQPSIDAGLQNLSRSDIRFTQNHHLTAAISDWAHAEGLPFNIAESARFRSVLLKARLVGDDYTPPNRKLIGGDMLSLNHSKIMEKNTEEFLKKVKNFGALAMGDGATVHRMPLVNELWQTGEMPPTVFGIHDCTGHMAAGGKKDALYIAGLFEPNCHKFDPDNSMGLIDIFAFDGASNVQKAGDILNVKYPTSHTIHGVEHVFSLFFDDCAKLKPIKVGSLMTFKIGSLCHLDLTANSALSHIEQPLIHKICRLYNVFGSGASHGIYAQFMEQSREHNNGRAIGLLRGAGTRMASWFYAMHRALRLRGALMSTIHQAKFATIGLVKTDDRVRECVQDINDPQFWKSIYQLLRAVFPALRALRYADSAKPSMDKIYMLSHRLTQALTASKECLNNAHLFPSTVDVSLAQEMGLLIDEDEEEVEVEAEEEEEEG